LFLVKSQFEAEPCLIFGSTGRQKLDCEGFTRLDLTFPLALIAGGCVQIQ
jgi:hypothetical protein